MNGSSWTRRVAYVLGAGLLGFVLACGTGAPDNPTPEPPSPSTTTYPHPSR